MAKIIISTNNITGLLRKDEDIDLHEYRRREDGRYVGERGGKYFGTLRYKKEWANEGDYWELEIPSWDYPQQNFMITPKEPKG